MDSRGANTSCVLGHQTVYRRRIRTAACFTPDNLNHIVSQTNCACTPVDYECDFGFERTLSSGICSKIMDPFEEETYIKEQCEDITNQGMYNVSMGYRLIPGDTCSKPLPQYQPVTKNCPTAPSVTSSTSGMSPNSDPSNSKVEVNSAMVGLLTIAFLAVTLASLVGGICLGARNDKVRNIILKKTETTKYSRVNLQFDEDEEDKTPE